MKNIFKIGFFTLALLATACDSDDSFINGSSPSSLALQSKTFAYSDSESYQWGNNDKVGLSIYNSSQSPLYDNIELYNANASGTTASFIAVNSDEAISANDVATSDNYVIYYPYSADVSDSTLSLDLSNQAEYRSIDLVVSRGTIEDISSRLDFEHRLALITLTFATGGDYIAADLLGLNFSIEGLAVEGSYNILSDNLTVSGTTATISDLTFDDSSDVTIQIIALPQTIANGHLTISCEASGSVAAINETFDLAKIEKGMEYKYSVDISSDTITITQGSITAWGEGGTVASGNAYVEEEFIIEVGDYILYDGSLLKAADYAKLTEANPAVGVFYLASEEEGASRAISVHRLLQNSMSASSSSTIASESNDGRINMDAVISADGSFDKWPVLKWCEELNKEKPDSYSGVNGVWYLPARYEMITSGDCIVNTIFSTYSDSDAALVPTNNFTGTASANIQTPYTYAIGLLGDDIYFSVGLASLSNEEKIMESIYRAGGDPFADVWESEVTSTNWQEGDDLSGMVADSYGRRGGFNIVEFCNFRQETTLTAGNAYAFNYYAQHWTSTSYSSTAQTFYRTALSRSTNGGGTFVRGPAAITRNPTTAANYTCARAILRY